MATLRNSIHGDGTVKPMQQTTGADATVTVWWTPPCGYLHLERNPTALHLNRCPDGHERDA